MDVILLENIRNLGDMGEKVNVRPGYGRNFLIPQGKAIVATGENLKRFEAQRAELEKKAQQAKVEALARAERINQLQVTITARTSDEGKLFGSISVKEIADAVVAAGEEMNKSEVHLPDGPIRAIGEFDIECQLHSEVTATVHLKVVGEG